MSVSHRQCAGSLSQQRHLHGQALQRDHLRSEQRTGCRDQAGTSRPYLPGIGTEEMDW